MNDATTYYISRYKLNLVANRDHEPDIKVDSTRSGQRVVVSCGCGTWSTKFSGCNEAGVCYAIRDGVKKYQAHAKGISS